MPEFTFKEVRLPELHLPEIKRDEIVRALAGVRLPDVDLAGASRTTLKVPTVALTGDDIRRLVAAGAAITRFVRPSPSRVRAPRNPFARRSRSPIAMIVRPRAHRSRRPLVLGGIVVAVVAIWAIMRRPEVRHRLEVASREARERIATWRAQDLRPDEGWVDIDSTHVVGSTTDPQGFANVTDAAASETVIGGAAADDVPAFEESQTPR